MARLKLRYAYGVERGEVAQFIAENPSAQDYLGKFKRSEGVYWNYARSLCMFFKWLRLRQGLSVSADAWLDMVDVKLRGNRLDKAWAKTLLLSFSRDNPDFQNVADRGRYQTYFIPVKGFCEYHELPVTASRGVFGKTKKRKYREPAFSIDFARRVLTALNQRDRTIGTVALMSGQSIGQVLGDINHMKDYVWRELDTDKVRVRLDFPERKGNDFPYFSFVGFDAVQELRKYRVQRGLLVKELGQDPETLFITKSGAVYTEAKFFSCFREMLTRKGIYTGIYSARSHMFRKIFEQEASPPERGISKLYVAFMMGHATPVNSAVGKLDAVGGTYDQSPFVDPRAVEGEYAKLEPFLNVFSGNVGHVEGLSQEKLRMIDDLLNAINSGEWELKRRTL